ncbi:hypothetical protein HMN09_00045200 [Mycena chlorophos]|uniref:NYN domain-containing protein n=1 Tax=Mycena chlorophos TaxID=658473 RepID=A0A8H6WMI5_MYCCL|nr:hypothetical protein HMN09_00045200 [Mycena chlorophos]
MQSSSSHSSPSNSSPYTTYSIHSEPTSDELPDLGRLTAVLREAAGWNQRLPPRTTLRPQQFTSTAPSSSMEHDSELFSQSPAPEGSTVWSRRPIASYLDSVSRPTTTDADGRSPSPGSGSNTELELEPADYELSDLEDLEQPSLGLLDGALSFLAAERARWTAQREAGTAGNEGAWKHVVEPRRKRRRKRRNAKNGDVSRDDPPEEGGSLPIEDAEDSSSSFDYTTTATSTTHQSVPATPARSRKERRRQQALAATSGSPSRTLIHSKSTPQLRPLSLANEPHPHYPRVMQLRSLAKKLGKLFPPDQPVLSRLIPDDDEFQRRFADDEDFFVDPRGPPPGENDTLIHIFIDYSNILIGLLSHLKRNPRILNSSPSVTAQQAAQTAHAATPAPQATAFPFTFPLKPGQRLKHLSHTALALILERGRPISRRVLVTSSPLYQSMTVAERLGYEVRVYARVPDLGDGADRLAHLNNGGGSGNGGRPGQHGRSLSAGAGGLMGVAETSGVTGEYPTLRNPRLGGATAIDIPNANANNTGSTGRRRRGHVRRTSGSAGSTSTESEYAQQSSGGGGFPQAFIRSLGGSGTTTTAPAASSPPTYGSLPATSSMPAGPGGSGLPSPSTGTPPTKIRYREQGVDELLQLKLHQALAALDGPPPEGSTIVLATGDGNVGQFNEDGFLGPVRTALKKGWKVELYAWEEGLSRAWMREFGEWAKPRTEEGETTGRFRVVGLEQFASELLEIY